MIVQTDFPDHWKTELLVQLTDETAVRCVLRLWAHCQHRKQWEFKGITPKILSVICRWRGDADLFFLAMSQTFLDISGDSFTVHDWDKINGSLIGRWEGGKATQKAWRAKAKPGLSLGQKEGDREIDRLDREKENPSAAPRGSDDGIRFADWFKKLLPSDVRLEGNWKENWAKAYDDMIRLDRRTKTEIKLVCEFGRKDEFWAANFLSPIKLRKRKDGTQYFDIFTARMKGGNGNTPLARGVSMINGKAMM